MISQGNTLLLNLVAVTAFMFAGWLVSLKSRNVTVVDTMWGLGFVLIAWMSLMSTQVVGAGLRGMLLCGMVTLWGLRLSIHLAWRNRGAGEDPRYGLWRTRSGSRFWIVSLFKVFLLQAVVLWLIALNMQMGISTPAPSGLTWFDALGALIWGAGFFFESAADWQLAKFKSNPDNQGRVMAKGLWAFSRHPNYFGEVLVWWGIFAVTLSYPANAWTIVSPILITLVVLKMTGIPLTETLTAKRRPGYECYRRKTSAFVPWLPKKEVVCEHAD